jgi:single-strand DNA-binding protein
MSGINVFTFSGRIGRDAETRTTGSGKSVTGFPVAIDIGYGDNKHSVWVDCAMWGERGEKIAEYLIKGSSVTVTGEADLQTYESQGVERTKLTCRVNDVQLPPKAAASDRPQQRQETTRRAPAPAPASGSFDDDDIPF